MAKIYKHLTTQERAVMMTMRADLCSTRSIAKRLRRSASTISRELLRMLVVPVEARHTPPCQSCREIDMHLLTDEQ